MGGEESWPSIANTDHPCSNLIFRIKNETPKNRALRRNQDGVLCEESTKSECMMLLRSKLAPNVKMQARLVWEREKQTGKDSTLWIYAIFFLEISSARLIS